MGQAVRQLFGGSNAYASTPMRDPYTGQLTWQSELASKMGQVQPTFFQPGDVAGGMAAHAVSPVGRAILGSVRGAAGAAEEAGPLWRNNALDALGEWQEKGTPEQLAAHLRKYKGAKAQADWAGLDEFTKGKGSVSKGEVAKFLEEGQMKVGERVLGEPPPPIEDMAIGESRFVPPGTKFHQYVTPGADPGSYRELFVTAPPKKLGDDAVKQASQLGKKMDDYADRVRRGWRPSALDNIEFSNWRAKHKELLTPKDWHDGHGSYSDIPNPVVRIRFNQRADVGGAKGIHLEELQKPNPSEQAKMPEWALRNGNMMGMKRAIRWAADHDLDQVTWTTGQQQIDRYNLALKDITFAKEYGDGKISVAVGGVHRQLGPAERDELKKLLGSRVSQLKDGIDLTHDPLTIGGAWAKHLYDEELVNDTNKFVKRWGGKVDSTEISTTGPQRAQVRDLLDEHTAIEVRVEGMPAGAERNQLTTRAHEIDRILDGMSPSDVNHETVHRLRLTPALKAAAKRGMELSQAPKDQETGVA